MEQKELIHLLQMVADGDASVNDALLRLRQEPFEDLGFAKPDLHRAVRQGTAEVIYGASKTPEQIARIAAAMRKRGQRTVLITRMSREAADYAAERLPLQYDEVSCVGIVGEIPEPDGCGKIVIATGGTSDMPVAEEAALTAEAFGNETVRLYDVGVAGLHRLCLLYTSGSRSILKKTDRDQRYRAVLKSIVLILFQAISLRTLLRF